MLEAARRHRWMHLAMANLRILLGFAFLPAGLKKVIGQRFTEPENIGAFHQFLHAFYDTGFFYRFVGGLQLCIALLLLTQTYALLGAFMALPVFTAILVFCYSTSGIPTAIAVTFMWLGTAALIVWDRDRWFGILSPNHARAQAEPAEPLVDLDLWRWCGAAIFVAYLGICALAGGIYRPRGVELDNPAFYTLPMITLFPVVTFAIEQRRRRRTRRRQKS